MNNEDWLGLLLKLWLLAFAGLLVFLFLFFVGFEVDGRTMYQLLMTDPTKS